MARLDCAVTAVFLHVFHSVVCLTGERESRLYHPKYPPVIWYPEFPMFHNRTNPARIVVQMHDSLDFFCPDYINSQYQSFTGAKKLPSEYGAEEIYMVDGQDYQACFAGLSRGSLAKKHARLLLRCPGKTISDTKTKAKFQYTVSFRMFSPVPKGPEFSCNQEYYFLGIFPGHNHNEEAMEKALCSLTALRLQILVSCSENSPQQNYFSYPSPNVIQLDRPAQLSEFISTTAESSPDKATFSTTAEPDRSPDGREMSRVNSKNRSNRPGSRPANGLHVARSDRKIIRNSTRHASSKRTQSSTQSSLTTVPLLDTVKSATDSGVRIAVDFGGDEPDVALTATSISKSTVKPSLKHSAYSSAASLIRLRSFRWSFFYPFFVFLFIAAHR